ncbi:multicopper oxidase family protein [Streptomyces sp. NPDC014006]|uniref:multicopper oxidase family protein n=1 Tax=Streptomyces sp. NPDC014006 TaxID=3364870 RepID=UPI0037011ED0
MSNSAGNVPDANRRRPGRHLITVQALAAALLVIAAAVVYTRGASAAPTAASTTEPPLSTAQQQAGMTSGQPFADPPVLDTATSPNMTITLNAHDTRFEVAGKQVWGQSYNGSFIAPTLHLVPGERATITLVNNLSVATNLHFHGLHVSPSNDSDDSFLCIAPGTTFHYHLDLPADHPAGTYWYHSHSMGTTCPSDSSSMAGMEMPPSPGASFSPGDVENQIFAGLSGAMVVGDDRALLPSALRNITTHAMNLKDVQLDKTGHIVQNTATTSIDSDAPTVRLVNGQLLPVLTIKPGETQLWRLGNVGADIWYHLKLDGYRFTVIGQDGVPAAKVTTADTLLLPPGKRYDVLVTAGSRPGGTTLRSLAFSNGPDGDNYPDTALFKVNVAGRSQPRLPTVSGALPSAPTDLSNASIAQKRSVTLSGNDSDGFLINGRQFGMDSSVFNTPAKLNTVEEWTITNEAGEDHPFHIHTDSFQVISINGVPQSFVGRQDIVPVPHAVNGVPGKVVIRVPFSDFTGKVMFHCHIAAHEDNGMMSYLDVVD